MRPSFDCAVINTNVTHDWARQALAAIAPSSRVHLKWSLPLIDCDAPNSSQALCQASMQLRSFDACLLPVVQHNLPWVRTALLAARGRLHTPVIALVNDLAAVAINDLFRLGLADFIRTPITSDDLRIRIQRLFVSPQETVVQPLSQSRFQVAEPSLANGYSNDDAFTGDPLIDRLFSSSGIALNALAMAAVLESVHYQQSFRELKGKIVEAFERTYIRALLKRHSGNIAMAARTAQKHRRAFWAQMRKYDIDAAVFRNHKPCAPYESEDRGLN